MTREQAEHIAEKKRAKLGIAPDMEIVSAERAIVEYKSNPDKPGPVIDRVAWILTYANALSTVTVQVDDRNGRILKVQRSR